jgi:hypothetical protein
VHQVRVPRIGLEGIECEVGTECGYPEIVLMIGGVEPLEGMILVAERPGENEA